MRPAAPVRPLLLACSIGLFATAPAWAGGPDACTSAIDRASSKYESRIHKALADCEVKDATGGECKIDKRDKQLAKADDTLSSRLASACTSSDLAALGFPAECDDASGGAFTSSFKLPSRPDHRAR